MGRKLTHDEQVKAINAVNPNVEILGEIINSHVRVLCRCTICHHEWRVTPSDLKNRNGCPECAKVKMGDAHRLTHSEHVAEIAAKNPGVEIIGKITRAKDKVLTRCRACGYEWKVAPMHLKKGHGCPKCAGKVVTHDEHMAAIIKANPNIEVLEKITNVDKKVLCRCKICSHEWMTTPDRLKHGYGCPECGKIKIANAKRKTHAEHVADIKKANPNIEILEEITKARKKVLCRCLVCGNKWNVVPYSLKVGCGCPKCAKTGFLRHDVGKLYIMVDDLEVPTMMKIGVSVREDRSKQVLKSAHKAGVTIPALHVAKTWEGPTDLMQRIEQMMHENYEGWNIKFPAKFNGCTEFFQYNPDTAEAFDIIEETLHEIINANKAA